MAETNRDKLITRWDLPLLLVLTGMLTAALAVAVLRDINAPWKTYQRTYAKLVAEQGSKAAQGVRVEQRIVEINGRQLLDRCQTCHLGMDNPNAAAFPAPFKPHPPMRDAAGKTISGHDVQKIGCIVCHAGNGRGLNEADAHGDDRHWLQPVRTGASIQASCAQCHNTNATDLRGAPVLARGRALFQRSACWACHQIEGVAAGKVGPILTGIADRLSPAAIDYAIRQPKAEGKQPDSQMPQFALSDDNRQALVVFLMSQTRQRVISHPLPEELPRQPVATAAEPAEQGKDLFHVRGCSACHSVRLDDDTFTGGRRCPELTYAGRMRGKEYVLHHMQAPKEDVPDSIMPPFTFLPQSEREALAAFILAQDYKVEARAGETPRQRATRQFATYCASCHGEHGNGLGAIAAALDPKPKNFEKKGFVLAYHSRFAERLLDGVPGTAMPPWKDVISEEDAAQLVAYIREDLAELDPQQTYTRETVPAPPKPTGEALFASYARGQELFMHYCSGCHGRQGTGKGANAYDLLALGRKKSGDRQGEMLPRNLRNRHYQEKDGILTRQRMYQSIRLGVPGASMPPWVGVLSDDRILDLLNFVTEINNETFAKRLKDKK